VIDEDSTLSVDLDEINSFFDKYVNIDKGIVNLKMGEGLSSATPKGKEGESSWGEVHVPGPNDRTIKLLVLKDFPEEIEEIEDEKIRE
jgi:hypothetical protein